jgi:diadenosine tetraphosphatase ApaH/serine/threonine PP2A family protein phosphatase
VITDIHANLAALEASLETIDETGVEEVWCLGDVLGYGAEPDQCAALVEERCSICLVGNHDLAVLGELDISAFSEAAAEAAIWTRENVSEDTLNRLRELSPAGRREEIGLFHASPRDPVWEYVLSAQQAAACFDAQGDPVALIGHSHVALFFHRPEGGADVDIQGAQAGAGEEIELDGGHWLLNPGSIGQPRDGDPRAAWLELDTAASRARFHRVPYDVERAAAAIVAAGLPERLGERLLIGQ